MISFSSLFIYLVGLVWFGLVLVGVGVGVGLGLIYFHVIYQMLQPLYKVAFT